MILEEESEGLPAPVVWFGGKGNFLSVLVRHVPKGGVPYCEPYMGAASLFFARDPAPVEVLNDKDEDLVNLFRCLQDERTMRELERRCRWTLFARAEYLRALSILADPEAPPLDRAWAFFVAKNQGMQSGHQREGNWSRSFTTRRGMAGNVARWNRRLGLFEEWRERLMRVQIDNRDAIEVIRYWDNENAVFYVDPPYHPDTRRDRKVYAHEPDHAHHEKLVEQLLRCRGAVVLSGYDHPVYRPLVRAGWTVTKIDVTSAIVISATSVRAGGRERTFLAAREEMLWSNPRAVEMLRASNGRQLTLDIDALDPSSTPVDFCSTIS